MGGTLIRDKKARGGSRPMRMLVANAVLTLLLIVGMGLYGLRAGADSRRSETRDTRLRELNGRIALYDEVLTMSARMGAATGDRQWEERYNQAAPKLDAAIREVRVHSGTPQMAEAIGATDIANVKLVGLETLAFRLAREGRSDSAMNLLLGPEYVGLKKQYAAGMAGVTADVTAAVSAGSRQRALAFLFGSLAMVLVLIVVWLGSFRITRQFIIEQRKAQAALRERVKELDCLYGIARLVEKPGIALDELMQGVVNLLAGATQFPDATGACARVGEKEYRTPNWDGTTLRIRESVRSGGVETGVVELGYAADAGKPGHSFLPEEHSLLFAVAERLGRILERMQTATALRESEDRYRVAFENSAVGKIIAGVDGHLLRANQAFADMVGYTVKELQAGDYVRITHPDDVAMSRALVARLMTGTESYARVEKRYVHRDGSTVWADLSMVLLRDSRGQPLHFVLDLQNITERRRAETRMRESELKFRAIFDGASDGMFLVEQDSRRFVLANSSCLRMLGYSADEFANLSVADIHPEEDLPFIFGQIESQMQGEPGKRGDVRFKRRDRSLFPADLSSAAMMLGDKKCILIIFRDITERQQAEAALRESEERFRGIFDAARDGMVLADAATGRFVTANGAFCAMIGYSLEEVVRLSVPDIHPFESLARVAESFDSLVAGRISLAPDIPVKRRDGSVFRADVSAAAISMGGRSFLMGAFHDITERKQAEAALAESELKYRTVFESSSDAMMLLDTGKFLDCNEAALRVFGYSTRGEFLGRHPGEVSPPLQADGRESRIVADENIAVALRDGRSFFEWLHMRADGLVFPADVLLTPLDYQGRRVLQATVRDITPRKIAEAEIAEKNAELRQLNEVKNQLLGMAAHDLRNPLSVVSAASQFLLDDASRALPEAKRTDFMRRINASSEFMLKLIDDLLDVAKIESGKLDLELKDEDLCALIDENLVMNQMLAERKGIRLDFAHECGVPRFRFDRGKVEQVLNNLISNALKFSQSGTAVTVTASRVNGSAVVSVRDHGQGIPPEELDKLFKPFSKTSVRSTAGERSTGLGLAIAHKIVEGHHGCIWAESEVGKGSTFSFSLPVGSEASRS